RNKRDTRHAVGLEAIGRRSDRIASIIAGAVGNDARITRIVLFDLENDLHQIASDIRDLRKNTSGNAKHCRTERLADRKADKTWPGIVTRNEEQNNEHHQ